MNGLADSTSPQTPLLKERGSEKPCRRFSPLSFRRGAGGEVALAVSFVLALFFAIADYCKASSARTEHEIEAEVDRYIAHPGGAPCYKIGELKIKEMRAYAEAKLGSRFDLRAFHDYLLGSGQLPLDLLETRLKAWVEENLSASSP